MRIGLALAALCAAVAAACASAPPPRPPLQPPLHPVLLVHGFSGWHELGAAGAYFHGVREALRAEGVEVFDPPLPPFAAVERRAPVLARAIDAILRRTGARKVHLVAHSQGGLDSRYVVDVLGYGDRVASILTISTPHHGTQLADVVERLPRMLVEPGFVVLGHQLTRGAGVDLGEPDIGGSLSSLSTTGAASLNARMPGDPRVAAFSIAGIAGKDEERACEGGAWAAPSTEDFAGSVWPLWLLLKLASAGPGTNDGMVPTASMRWGTFLGCIAADHIDEIGLTRSADFDPIDFYRRIVRGLAELDRSGSDRGLRAIVDTPAPAP